MSALRLAVAVGFVLALLAPLAPARAEKVIISLSTHRVLISSNFTGADLVLFGSIEQDARTVGRAGDYVIVVTVIGPRKTVVTWRKERVFGVWVNASSRTFVEPPSYLAVLTNRPIEAIASRDILRRNRIGLSRFLLPQDLAGDIGDPRGEDPFRQAFVRLKMEQRLYVEQTNAITFITPSLFRASVPLPANVSVGDYEVDVKLFADGVPIASETSAFEIVKTGVEQLIAWSAREHSLLYGLATTMLAFLTGWLGSIVFRRD